MRGLINYFRQAFCKHDWIVEEVIVNEHQGIFNTRTNTIRVYMRCKKCGYHTKHWKS